MDKADKKRLLKEFKRKEQENFEHSLPMSRELFHQLFDFLDEKLGDSDCNNDLRFTKEFLSNNHVHEEVVLPWLLEHGGGCDCEVLNNVEERFE